jgi:hypothetical protein
LKANEKEARQEVMAL